MEITLLKIHGLAKPNTQLLLLKGIPRIEFIVLFQTIWLKRTPLLSNCIN